jgi:multiple sugar transport system ATP-binding protein
MASVRLRGIRKTYGDNPVIKGVDLDIEDGQFVVFVGPSGCGKSTLLRMIAGLEDITDGTLELGGVVSNTIEPARRGIAMVFQSYALYPHMTVAENMGFALKLAKVPKAEIAERVRHAAQILQIEHLLERKPKALSGGQRQRVAIGRAIVRKPEVFLFDEPLSNLDAALRAQTRVELARLHKDLQATMIYVTHDQVEAMTLGQKIVVTPRSCWMPAISARIWTRSLASRLESGSSIRNACGWRTIARPIATRCRCPPESARGFRSRS